MIFFPDIQIASNLESRIWYHHDGTPTHNALAVQKFLNRISPHGWIGRRGTV